MIHKFILPNHFLNAGNSALEEMKKDIKINQFEIDNNLTSFNKLVLEIECHPFDLLQLGVKIGIHL